MLAFLTKLSIWLFGAKLNKDREDRLKKAVEEDDVEAFNRMVPRKWLKAVKKMEDKDSK